jgi:hypothetical protein
MTTEANIQNSVITISTNLADLIAAIDQNQRYRVLLLVMNHAAELVTAYDREAAAAHNRWQR